MDSITLVLDTYILYHRIGNGSWTNDGVMTNAVDVIDGNTTTVQCTSTHLTSFAVLVSVAEGLEVHRSIMVKTIIIYCLKILVVTH